MNTTTHPGMIETVKDKGVAAIAGTGKVAQAAVDTTTHVVSTTVKDTAKVGGDVEKAATGLVGGAIKDVKEMAVETEQAVAAVTGGAFKAVGKVGSEAVDAVRTTVTKPVNNDKAASKETAPAAARN
jgi:hypothetical protein